MKKLFTFLGISLIINLSLSAQSCPCQITNSFYYNIVNSNGDGPTPFSNCDIYQLSTLKTSGKWIHVFFPKSVSQNTSPSCYGTYQVHINGNTYSSASFNAATQSVWFPASILNLGVNNISASVKRGTTSSLCPIASQKIILISPGTSSANLNVTTECVSKNTMKFKIAGTASLGVKLKVQTPSGSYDVSLNSSGTTYTPSVMGYAKLTIQDAFGNTLSSSTINSIAFNTSYNAHYSYTIPKYACIAIEKLDMKSSDKNPKITFINCSDTNPCPDGRPCVDGICQ